MEERGEENARNEGKEDRRGDGEEDDEGDVIVKMCLGREEGRRNESCGRREGIQLEEEKGG